jgi:hypothetical protein
MAVGDVKSSARGSGARYNDGKPALDLVPLRYLVRSSSAPRHRGVERRQRGGAACNTSPDGRRPASSSFLFDAMESIGAPWEEAAHVLDYGKKKYAAWNWAKGMAWSVTLGCATRHLRAIIAGEETDSESGLQHVGHVMCNLIFLLTFMDFYPEGDDLPRVFRPEEMKRAA